MALTLVNTNDTINASTLNQIINVLQQPSGGQELGHYDIAFNLYSTSEVLTCNVLTRSRNSVPVSISIDTADVSASGVNAPSTGHLTMGGAQVFARSNTTSTNGVVGGNYTMQY